MSHHVPNDHGVIAVCLRIRVHYDHLVDSLQELLPGAEGSVERTAGILNNVPEAVPVPAVCDPGTPWIDHTKLVSLRTPYHSQTETRAQ